MLITTYLQVDRITEHMQNHAEHGGLYALTFDINNGNAASPSFSVGAMADSAYEYLLKLWLMSGRTEDRYLDMCMLQFLSTS